ncbi:MAG: hypothetical protein ACJAQ6_000839 [Arenicella sp.]
MRFITAYNIRSDHRTTGLLLAIALHLIFALMLPDMPKLSLQGFDRPSSLTVFLSQIEEQDTFDQSLNQQLPLPANIDTLADPSLGSTSIQKGPDSIVSDAVEPAMAASQRDQQTTSLGSGADGDSTPAIRFDYATIRLFAKREASRYARLHPKEVERFARTFNRSRNYRRRSRTESYKDKLGDLYARSNSSDGDICFKQQREEAVDHFITNTVYFFRCDKQPKGLELDIEKKRASKG